MSTSAPAVPLAVVARQPIFNRKLEVHGYELLFRLDAAAQAAAVTAGDVSTAIVVVNSFVEFGLENVVGSAVAFLNVNREFLLSDFVRTLPKERVVLEVLEDVPPDAEVVARLESLAAAGYCLALDDFAHREELEPFLELASIVKLDISQVERRDRLPQVEGLKRRGLKLVGERVETHADLENCLEDGFDYFQGFFLARPATLQRHRAPDGDRMSALQTLALLNAPTTTAEQLERAISRDVTLSYRLLRVLNSAGCGLAGRVESLRQAIVHLGRNTIRNWVVLLLLSGMSNKPVELLTTGLVRARMCERIGEAINPNQADAYFTAGLFSILDAVLDTSMAQLVASLPLTPEVGQALTNRRGPIGRALAACIAYERWEWAELSNAPLPAADLQTAYLDALTWARTLTSGIGA
jgi:EAL and modified HD-GYP domain-containing signal transduction protein